MIIEFEIVCFTASAVFGGQCKHCRVLELKPPSLSFNGSVVSIPHMGRIYEPSVWHHVGLQEYTVPHLKDIIHTSFESEAQVSGKTFEMYYQGCG